MLIVVIKSGEGKSYTISSFSKTKNIVNSIIFHPKLKLSSKMFISDEDPRQQ